MTPDASQPEPAAAGAAVDATRRAHLPRPLSDPSGRIFVSTLTIALVRHGVTDMTAKNLLSGSSVDGPGLNAAGRVQAARAADAMYRIGRETWDRVAPVSRVVASPMRRTQDTGAALGRRLGLSVEADARAREVDFGAWEGLTPEEAAARDGDLIHRWQAGSTPAPGGESIVAVGERMDHLMRDLASDHAEACAAADVARTFAIASHAVAIKACVGASLGLAPENVARIWPTPASYTLLQLRVTSDGAIAERHLLCMGVPTG